MSIILKIIRETHSRYFFELPDIVSYNGKTVAEFNMCSPSGLIRALNKNQQKLHDLFINKEDFDACWETSRIERKKIVVEKYESKEQLALVFNKVREEKRKIRSKRKCAICGILCDKCKKMIGCCSDACYKIKLLQRNESVKRSHWCKTEGYAAIRDKRVETRKKNDELFSRKYIAWNKNKAGIYKLETIEKIRSATRLQFHREQFKKTLIEKRVDDFLREIGANFKYSFILSGRQYDFLLKDTNSILEIHGDFWHGNPRFWGNESKPLRDHQLIKRLDDVAKKRIANENGYEYFELWEYDIHNNWSTCVSKIMEILNGNR